MQHPNDIEKFSPECNLCKGAGEIASADYEFMECPLCWGTGVSNGHLSHEVSLDLVRREAVAPNYTRPQE